MITVELITSKKILVVCKECMIALRGTKLAYRVLRGKTRNIECEICRAESGGHDEECGGERLGV